MFKTILFVFLTLLFVITIWNSLKVHKDDKKYVPEVLNIHVNENNLKNLLSWKGFFFQVVKKTFQDENVIFLNTFLNFNLFNLIVINFL